MRRFITFMRTRSLLSIGAFAIALLLTLSGQGVLFGQAKTWTAPRTPDGQPDLQGSWTNATLTPLERPNALADKQVFTDQEASEFAKQTIERNSLDGRNVSPDVLVAYNDLWYERGTKVASTKQTSLIVDPPDGRIPPLTPEARKRAAELAEMRRQHPADGPEDRSLQERCIKWGTAGPPMLPGPYNNDYQIIQAPGYVVIDVEMIHDARIIPLDGRPHLPQNVRSWLGDSRGHWEGETLVVDTINFRPDATYRSTIPETLHLVERFTRVSPETILYQFTVDDPSTYTRPWTAALPMTKIDGPIYEYACHEGNYAMEGILGGARAQEKSGK
jgi:hypothetical protein